MLHAAPWRGRLRPSNNGGSFARLLLGQSKREKKPTRMMAIKSEIRRYPRHGCPSHVCLPCHRSAVILIDHVPRRLPPGLWARREAAVALMLGWLGLRAWWCCDARAAKFNLWLRPLKYLMVAVIKAIQVTKEMSYGRHPVWGLYVLFGLFQIVLPLMYISKVRGMVALRRRIRARHVEKS